MAVDGQVTIKVQSMALCNAT